jgi:RNA polymerase sigma factor (sigma-70 family)
MPLSNTEQSAWDTFYLRFATTIMTYLSRQVANQQDAEDLLMEVFGKASQESILGEFSEIQQIAWLRRVARNKVIDYYRHQGQVNWFPLIQVDELVDEDLTPAERVEQQEAYRLVYQAVQQLSPMQQELIRLRYGEELRFSEIAEILEKPGGTVRKMLTRTLRRLRTFYEQRERGQQ